MIKSTFRSLLALFLIGVLCACQAPATRPSAPAAASPEVSDITAETTVGPVTTRAPYRFKTSKSGTSTVHGALIVSDPYSMVPEEDGLFLVPFDSAEGTVASMPTFEPNQVPRAEIDESTGEFVFNDIEPGNYILAVLSASGSQNPASRSDGGFVIVKVTADNLDKTVEIGTVMFP